MSELFMGTERNPFVVEDWDDGVCAIRLWSGEYEQHERKRKPQPTKRGR